MSEGRLRALEEVREIGCLIAIDDFGTGYSNYSRLLTMSVDIVKFDRSMFLSARAGKAEATLSLTLSAPSGYSFVHNLP